jgi:hypothetical protein
MNDDQLVRSLQSVGMTCFVKYFEYFAGDIPREDVIEKLKKTTTYTANSCASRTSTARRIIKYGLAKKALALVIGSESPSIRNTTREEAQRLSQKL